MLKPLTSQSFGLGLQIFLVAYSILYGVMLQDLPKNIFPLARIFFGYKNHEGIIDNKKEHKKIWLLRSLISTFLLNILPAGYLWFILSFLNGLHFPCALWGQLVYIVLVFLSSFGVFGFYRIYFAIIVKSDKLFFDVLIKKEEINYMASTHLIWAIYYLFLGPFLLFIFFR